VVVFYLSNTTIQRDALQLLGVRGWRRRAENRDEWRHALKGPGRGCSAIHGWMDGIQRYCFVIVLGKTVT
jgi:hypothetical protein